jgi:hypothetical protein
MAGYQFKRDVANSRLGIVHPDGTEVWRLTAASGHTMLGGVLTVAGDLTVTAGVVTLPTASLDADALATTAYTGANYSVVATSNPIGGGLILYRIKTAAGAAATINVTVTDKSRVLDVWAVAAAAGGGAGDGVTVGNAANVITTTALDMNVADTAVARTTLLDNAFWEIAAGGTLRVITIDGGGANSPAYDVYVLACKVT